jgi:hypothetical protein
MARQYIPENQKQTWLNQINVWDVSDNDPGFENRIEFHDPAGKVYVAKTFGTETIFGRTVQKGVGARVLEWANSLLQKAYVTDSVTKNGVTWYVARVGANGQPLVKDPNGTGTVPSCAANPSCVQLQNYASVPAFIREAMSAYGLDLSLKGLY